MENFKVNDDKFKKYRLELANRIKKARSDLRLIRPEACKLLDVSISTLQAWENGGREPSASQIIDIASIYKISATWLLIGSDALENRQLTQSENLDKDNEFVLIPRYDIQASAGQGSWSETEKTDFSMAFRRYWIDNYIRVNPEFLSVITVKGDSMEGVLNDRDTILINHKEKDPQEGIYVLRIDGHLLVKQIQRLPDLKIKVISKNTDYEPFTIDLKKPPVDFEIVGKVVWYGRTL